MGKQVGPTHSLTKRCNQLTALAIPLSMIADCGQDPIIYLDHRELRSSRTNVLTTQEGFAHWLQIGVLHLSGEENQLSDWLPRIEFERYGTKINQFESKTPSIIRMHLKCSRRNKSKAAIG